MYSLRGGGEIRGKLISQIHSGEESASKLAAEKRLVVKKCEARKGLRVSGDHSQWEKKIKYCAGVCVDRGFKERGRESTDRGGISKFGRGAEFEAMRKTWMVAYR